MRYCSLVQRLRVNGTQCSSQFYRDMFVAAGKLPHKPSYKRMANLLQDMRFTGAVEGRAQDCTVVIPSIALPWVDGSVGRSWQTHAYTNSCTEHRPNMISQAVLTIMWMLRLVGSLKYINVQKLVRVDFRNGSQWLAHPPTLMLCHTPRRYQISICVCARAP